MKRFPKLWAASAAAGVLFSPAWGREVLAQEQPVVSARPGQRVARPLPRATEEGVRLSLSEAVGFALANNEDLNVSVNSAESSRFALFQSEGIFDPLTQVIAPGGGLTRGHTEGPPTFRFFGSRSDNLDFSAQVSQLAPTGGVFSLGFAAHRASSNSRSDVINPSFRSGLTLFVSQPLLRNFGRDATIWLIRIARETRDATYQNYVRSVQATVNSVEQGYWDLVYALQNLEVKKESLRIAQDLNRITKIKIDVGSLAPIDITQTEVGIATAEQDIITAEGLVGDAQDRLKRLMSFDPNQWTVPIVPTDQVRSEETTIQLDDGTKTALARRPEILAQVYAADSDRIRYEYSKNQTRPRLDLVGSYGYTGTSGTVFNPDTGAIVEQTGYTRSLSRLFDLDVRNWSIGINFSLPIFNRAAVGARGVARYNWESSKARLTALEQNVVVEVRAAARAMETARRQIRAAGKGRELAEKNLDAEKKKFDNGMTTSFQVTQIQRDLSVARTSELQALAVYRKALAAYHFFIADNLDWKGVRIEGIPETNPPPREARMEAR